MYGNPGQTNYGAGNGFKDAVSCMRRVESGVGQSICFGAMDLGIVADQPSAKRKLLALGLNPMKVSEITACLDHALITNMPLVGYGKFMWKTWYRTSALSPSILKQYATLIRRHCHYFKAQTAPTRGFQLGGNNVATYVVEVLKTVALLSDEDITLDATMADLGADSQDIQQIYNVLREDIGFKDTDLNIMEMGDMLLKELIAQIDKIKPSGTGEKKQFDLKEVDDDKILASGRNAKHDSMQSSPASVSSEIQKQETSSDPDIPQNTLLPISKIEPKQSKGSQEFRGGSKEVRRGSELTSVTAEANSATKNNNKLSNSKHSKTCTLF